MQSAAFRTSPQESGSGISTTIPRPCSPWEWRKEKHNRQAALALTGTPYDYFKASRCARVFIVSEIFRESAYDAAVHSFDSGRAGTASLLCGRARTNKEWRPPITPLEQRCHTRRLAREASRQSPQSQSIQKSLRFRGTQILSVVGN
jgi:hypothetical protein